MPATQTRQIFLPRRGTRVSTTKSSQVVRNTVADTWRWLWPDMLMPIVPLAMIPIVYIAIFHLSLEFLGMTLHNSHQQLLIGLLFGGVMTSFALTTAMLIACPRLSCA